MNSQNFSSQGQQNVTYKLRWLGCALVFFTLVLAACNLTGGEANDVAFEVTPYQAQDGVTAVGTPAGAVSATNAAVSDTVTTTTGNAPINTETISTTASTESAQSVAEAPAVPQAVAAVAPNTLRYSGEIAAESQIVVVAETAGMILALPLQIGDVVTKGDLVAQLDTTTADAVVQDVFNTDMAVIFVTHDPTLANRADLRLAIRNRQVVTQ